MFSHFLFYSGRCSKHPPSNECMPASVDTHTHTHTGAECVAVVAVDIFVSDLIEAWAARFFFSLPVCWCFFRVGL